MITFKILRLDTKTFFTLDVLNDRSFLRANLDLVKVHIQTKDKINVPVSVMNQSTHLTFRVFYSTSISLSKGFSYFLTF